MHTLAHLFPSLRHAGGLTVSGVRCDGVDGRVLKLELFLRELFLGERVPTMTPTPTRRRLSGRGGEARRTPESAWYSEHTRTGATFEKEGRPKSHNESSKREERSMPGVRSAARRDAPTRAVGRGVKVLAPELFHVSPAAAELVWKREFLRTGHQRTVARMVTAVSGLLDDPEAVDFCFCFLGVTTAAKAPFRTMSTTTAVVMAGLPTGKIKAKSHRTPGRET